MDLKEAPTKFLGSEDERAVSPVIGVVLMVAVTVILAAVIAAFVMGMGDDLGDSGNINAAVDTSVDEGNVTVKATDMGGADGITVVNESGEPVDKDLVLTATGSSDEWAPSENGTVSVLAFTGDTGLTAGEPVEDQVDSVSTVTSVEVENANP